MRTTCLINYIYMYNLIYWQIRGIHDEHILSVHTESVFILVKMHHG